MNTATIIKDLCDHFPPSAFLGRIEHLGSHRGYKRVGKRDVSINSDGCYLFKNKSYYDAFWERRKVSIKGTLNQRSSCVVWGTAQLKDDFEISLQGKFFLETCIDGVFGLKGKLRNFRKVPHTISLDLDESGKRSLTWRADNMQHQVDERRTELLEKSNMANNYELPAPYATAIIDHKETTSLCRLLNFGDIFSFSLQEGVLRLHTLTWDRKVKKQKINFLPQSKTSLLISHKNENQRNNKLSKQNVLDKIAVSSTKNISSFLGNPDACYIPSYETMRDWLPSKVLSHILEVEGTTTIKLYPRLYEVIKETPTAIYTYRIHAEDIKSTELKI